jgi:hypothetical protein
MRLAPADRNHADRQRPLSRQVRPRRSGRPIASAVQTQSADKLVAPGVGFALLAAHAAIAAVAGTALTNRRDIA